MTTYTGTGSGPVGIAYDNNGNMWTANYGGGSGNSVTKITTAGVMTTYTGTGASPQWIAYDGANMWTANQGGNSVTKITSAGVMTTYSLPAGSEPDGIVYDNNGNMWTANYGNSSVTVIATK